MTPTWAYELPVYQSHKRVRAARIDHVERQGSALHIFIEVDGMLRDVEVSPSLVARGVPGAGDYLVIYSDGYVSWSPKRAFEDRYGRLPEHPGRSPP